MATQLSIARDFSKFPGGRYRANGKGSGEQFRDDYLVPRLSRGEHLIIDLDGTSGYPSSFLEEAFGGLVRRGYSPEALRERLEFAASPEFAAYASLIWKFVDDARAR